MRSCCAWLSSELDFVGQDASWFFTAGPAASEGTRIYSELVISAFAGKMSIYMNNFSYYNGY